jgi:uncharacterized protein YbjT (DUF2867 family)
VSFPAGVETIAGDLTRPADWAGALEGADGVFLMSGHDGMTELLTRARDAGIRRAVLLSASAVEADDLDNAVSRYQAQAEADVRASGLEWTFLRPNSFMTNALEWAEQLRAGDVVRAPFGGVRVAMIGRPRRPRAAAQCTRVAGAGRSRPHPGRGPGARPALRGPVRPRGRRADARDAARRLRRGS